MLIARDYQDFAVTSIFDYFQKNRVGNPLVAMPTGTGKSLVIAVFLARVFAAYANQRVMVLTHVKELIEQNHAKLMQYWEQAPAGIYSAGLNRRDVWDRIIFAGIGSVAKRAEEFGHVDLLLIDEAHLVGIKDDSQYLKFIAALLAINPALRVIGLTATAYRLGQGMLTDEGGLFTDICFDATGVEAFNWFISEGYLAPLVPKRTQSVLDVDGVSMRGGEYVASQLQHAVDRYEITLAALQEAQIEGENRNSWLVFTSGVEHAIHATEILLDLGISAACVHGGNKKFPMSSKERDENIRRFKAGEIRALVNNNVLTTGFDHPAIDMIVMLRPTGSPGLWVQMLGRGTRPLYAPGYDLTTRDGRLAAIAEGGKHNCLVLDFAGNTPRLGPINDPVIPNPKGKKGGSAPVKLCDRCDAYCHASVRFCPCCGFEFKFEVKIRQQAGTDELITGELPVVETFKVDHIAYRKHEKVDRPPSIKVTYYCNLKSFSEYVCLEHIGGAKAKGERWWRKRTGGGEVPETVDEALEQVDKLRTSTHLRVWTNKRYPEIMDYCFDGTAFGTEEPDPTTFPTIAGKTIDPNSLEDDIPF